MTGAIRMTAQQDCLKLRAAQTINTKLGDNGPSESGTPWFILFQLRLGALSLPALRQMTVDH